jgi:HlyD family secretion protein
MALLLAGCSGRNHLSDAYGNFETVEYLIPAEGQGRILDFSVEEGRPLGKDELVGLIDTSALHLQKEQLLANIRAIEARKSGIESQIRVHETRMQNLLLEKDRLGRLLEDGAATGKQMDDLEAGIATLKAQIEATRSNFESIEAEIKAARAQVRIVEDNISRHLIRNPVKGTVLEKYAEAYEMAAPGKILYKIADLEKLILRVYISGDQLHAVQLGQEVRVLTDDPSTQDEPIKGRITWISDKSEFTPKIIQTREERVKLVYAVKIEVPNDGSLKIGMPGEIRL